MIQRCRLLSAFSVVMAFAVGSSEGFADESGKDEAIPFVESVQDGNWSSPATWSGGIVPGDEDAVAVGHAVTYDLDSARIAGVTITDTGKLTFSPDKSVELETDRNVVNLGEFEMRPASPDIVHRLRFVDVDETKFVGGGMEILETDVGLWTAENGVLDAVGAAKTPWTRLTAGAEGKDAEITVQDAEGWQIGDRVVVVPTEHPDAGERSWYGFEERVIESVDGGTIGLDSPLEHDHPTVENPFNEDIYTAEVLNLTRNIKIEGTGDHTPSYQTNQNGRAHVIFLATAQPQTVQYVELSHLGPRKPEKNHTSGVLGRYPLHFHHAGDGSRDSLIEGVVAWKSGNRGFVPHASHGITLRSTIAYDVFEDPYWWDQPKPRERDPDALNINNTDDLLIDRAVAAQVMTHPAFRGVRLGGFVLTRGRNNSLTIQDSVAVGVQGKKGASGMHWPEAGQAVWNFTDGNIAHNNKVSGIFVWQNNKNDLHEIKNFVAYHNGLFGIDHGAYGNGFQYSNLALIDNGEAAFNSRAASSGPTNIRKDGYAQAIERLMTTDTFIIAEHNYDYSAPTLVKDSVIGDITVDENARDTPGIYDFVNVTKPDGTSIESADFALTAPRPESVFRVQHLDNTAFQITGTGEVTEIEAFYDIETY